MFRVGKILYIINSPHSSTFIFVHAGLVGGKKAMMGVGETDFLM